MSINVGLHWPKQWPKGLTYRPDMPMVENCYLIPDGDLDIFSVDAVFKRVKVYAEAHPLARILVRVDYQRGEAFKGRSAPMPAALHDLLTNLAPLGRRLVLQYGNEPQLEGADNVGRVADAYKVFYDFAREHAPQSLIASIPVAPYNADRLGAPDTVPGEAPWLALHRYLLTTAIADNRAPDVLSLHAYSDGDRLTVVDADGDAFAWNVLAAWHAVHVALHLDDLPVWVSEFNTAARGITAPHRPADNYVQGAVQAMIEEAPRLCPSVKWMTWFVGAPRRWDAFAPLDEPADEYGHGALSDLTLDLASVGAGPVSVPQL